MKPSLRKKHRLIWIILLLEIPLFFVFALKEAPQAPTQEIQTQVDSTAIGQIEIQNN